LRACARREVVSVCALFSLYAESIKRVFFCHRKKMRILKEEKEFRVYGFGRKKCPNNYRGRRRTKDTTASSPRERKRRKEREIAEEDDDGKRYSARTKRESDNGDKEESLLFKKKSDRILSLSLNEMRLFFFFFFLFCWFFVIIGLSIGFLLLLWNTLSSLINAGTG